METFTLGDAKQLIKAAIDSKAITLSGGAGNLKDSKERAELDAAYLLTLLNALTKPPAQ